MDGQTVTVTNPDRVMYPAAGVTKREVVDYYLAVAPVLLPHLHDTPVSLRRFPKGVEGMSFFTKRCPANRPEFVDTADVPRSTSVAPVNACVINNAAAMAWIANLGAIELHAHLYSTRAVDRPKRMVFDLDPGERAGLIDCCHVALAIRDLLRERNLAGYVKTSGEKGLHILVPLNSRTTFAATSAFAKEIATTMAIRQPDRVTRVMTRSKRTEKVLIDWSQNARHKTTVAVYSLRARPDPTVSLPVTWGEIREAVERNRPDGLICRLPDALKRVAALGDLFANVLTAVQELPASRGGKKRAGAARERRISTQS